MGQLPSKEPVDHEMVLGGLVNVCRVCSIWGTNVDITYIIGVRY